MEIIIKSGLHSLSHSLNKNDGRCYTKKITQRLKNYKNSNKASQNQVGTFYVYGQSKIPYFGCTDAVLLDKFIAASSIMTGKNGATNPQ